MNRRKYILTAQQVTGMQEEARYLRNRCNAANGAAEALLAFPDWKCNYAPHVIGKAPKVKALDVA